MLVTSTTNEGTTRMTSIGIILGSTRTLRNLERDGMLTRTVYAEVPPRVDYALTSLGRTLIEPVDAFIRWAEQHRHIIDENRGAFDAR